MDLPFDAALEVNHAERQADLHLNWGNLTTAGGWTASVAEGGSLRLSLKPGGRHLDGELTMRHLPELLQAGFVWAPSAGTSPRLTLQVSAEVGDDGVISGSAHGLMPGMFWRGAEDSGIRLQQELALDGTFQVLPRGRFGWLLLRQGGAAETATPVTVWIGGIRAGGLATTDLKALWHGTELTADWRCGVRNVSGSGNGVAFTVDEISVAGSFPPLQWGAGDDHAPGELGPKGQPPIALPAPLRTPPDLNEAPAVAPALAPALAPPGDRAPGAAAPWVASVRFKGGQFRMRRQALTVADVSGELRTSWQATRDARGTWNLAGTCSLPEASAHVTLGGVQFAATMSADVNLKQTGAGLTADGRCAVRNLDGTGNGIGFTADELALTGTLAAADAGEPAGIDKIPDATPHGVPADNKPWPAFAELLTRAWTGTATIRGGAVRVPAQGIAIAGIGANGPFRFSSETGLTIPEGGACIDWQDADIGGWRLERGVASVGGTPERLHAVSAITMPGSLAAAALDATLARVDGAWRAEATAQVPSFRLTEADAALAPLRKAMGDATFSAGVSAQVQAKFAPGAPPIVTGTVSVAEGTVALPSRKFTIDGITTALRLDNLVSLQTAPSQKLTFTSARVSGTTLDRGSVQFALRGPQTLFLEKVELGWCGGQLATYAVDLDLQHPQGEATLYADGIEVNRVLALFRNLKGTGEGHLHGRIPVRYGQGKVGVSDAFLYAAPGEAGRLQLEPDNFIGTALGKSGADSATVARVKDALRDFQYNTFRLDLTRENTQDSLLRVKLEGTPRRNPGQEPIDLNVNLRGPLDQLLNLGLQMGR